MELAGIIIAFVLMSMAKKLRNDPIQANYNKTKGFRIAELVLSVINTVCTVIMGIFSIVFAVLAMQINEAGYNGYEFSREFEEAFEEFAELGMDGITIFNNLTGIHNHNIIGYFCDNTKVVCDHHNGCAKFFF